MIRTFLMVGAVGLIVLAVGVVILGTFPPEPASRVVEKVLPNEKFRSR